MTTDHRPSLAELELLARAASQGVWERSESIVFRPEQGDMCEMDICDTSFDMEQSNDEIAASDADAAHIAANCPATTLALVSAIVDLRALVFRAVGCLEERNDKPERRAMAAALLDDMEKIGVRQ